MSYDVRHRYNDEMVCPYCEYEESDSWEIERDSQEEWFQVECGNCSKTYLFERNVTTTYNTEKADCANGLSEHIWKNRVYAPREYSIGKQQCEVCYSDREISKQLWEQIDDDNTHPENWRSR